MRRGALSSGCQRSDVRLRNNAGRSAHQHISTSAHQHISTSAHQHISTSAHQHISRQQLAEIVDAIYGQGEVIVKEASSDYDSPPRHFPDAESLNADLDQAAARGFFFYSIYYPEAGGHVYERRIALIPEKCDGHTYRFKQEGWGLIRLQCRSRDAANIECNIAVNSEVRASNWSDTYPDMGDPAQWDWKLINSKAGRLTRLLRKLGKQNVEQGVDLNT